MKKTIKKITAILFVICLLVLGCLPAVAGDIPEALSYEDDAKVFIGTLLEFSDSEEANRSDIKEITVVPVLKIKGEVEVGVEQTYSECYFPKATPKQGAEYFFGYLPGNEVYIYEVESRTDDKITLHITDEFSERIQNYLDEGLYEMEEIARVNVGRKITLSEYMETSRELAKKVTFSLNGVTYDIDVDKFYEFSDKVLITDVKNTILKRMGADDWEDDILYITIDHRQDTLIDGFEKTTFACVTRFCEVDRYSQMMGRLPGCDFTMTWEDLAELYTFLPEDVQRELYAKNGAEVVEPNVTPIVIGVLVGAVVGGGIGGAVGVILARKKKK